MGRPGGIGGTGVKCRGDNAPSLRAANTFGVSLIAMVLAGLVSRDPRRNRLSLEAKPPLHTTHTWCTVVWASPNGNCAPGI
jgi:hypothetical protein